MALIEPYMIKGSPLTAVSDLSLEAKVSGGPAVPLGGLVFMLSS
ncbi:unnamed protein product [marine sediment metagenome]|uniref:Uncharacterized protein n=1 Tax=marine sediment metagenome TaxID=412755 RepID=X0ZJD6_9ZZZZ